MIGDLLIDEARSWLGTKWMHNVCIKGVGVDCVNFVWAVGNACDIQCSFLPLRYSRVAVFNQIEKFLDEHFTISGDRIEDCQKGDILMFNYNGMNNHLGFACGDNKMIHASFTDGKVVEHNIDEVWVNRFVRWWRV